MANYDYITATGVIVPDASAVKADVEAEYKQIFGDDFVVDPNTPQGVLVAAEVAARQSVARNNAELANQINPNYAGGVFLDAIWALTGGARRPATPSVVTATLSGVAGTVVASGSLARTTAGDTFQLVETVTVGAGGTVSGTFQSVALGAIPIGANSLTVVVSGVLGWETVTNPSAGTVGTATESDAASRIRRRQLIGLQSRSVAASIMSAVSAVDGVKSMTFLENTAATTQTISSVSLVAHSIWCCVDGGTNLDVASAILRSKSAGSAFNGSVSQSVTDLVSGQAYTVLFDRPTVVPMLLRVAVRSNSSIADPTNAVRNAVMKYVTGESEGETGFTIGTDVSPFEIASAIGREVPSLFVSLVEVATVATPTYQTTTYAIAINQLASLLATNVLVVIS